jgi:AmmeMemoRadiSam system protein B
MKAAADVRPSPIVGRWYPDDPHELANSIDRYLDNARLPELEGEVVAVIAPHAGHMYSGPVAGYAFAALRGLGLDLVVVAAPLHGYYPAPLLTTAHQAYATPLGEVPVDREAVEALDGLLSAQGLSLTPVRRDTEHSLEIELPFLQRAVSTPFKLLPLMMRAQDPWTARQVGAALAQLLKDRRAVLVGSSDLSHFYTQKQANRLDGEMLRQVESLDPEGVIRIEEQGRGFACGRGPLAAVLWAALGLGADRAKVLHYATSGEVSGDFDQVVGYGAAAIYRQSPSR